MMPHWIIEKKRDGEELTREEIRFFVKAFTDGRIPDYQMAAMAMAIYFRGMTTEETFALTESMMRSGSVLNWSSLRLPVADKHSTGGIGDKVSLILAPLVACCDIAVPMISGRGLGITGGTLDKLESIPGFRTQLDAQEMSKVIRACGCVITGQTAELVPADKKLYALRDVTGTVPSIPLITASIMSKKMAEGIDALVLDVKFGKGAFMRTQEDAWELARSMVGVGERMGKRIAALLTDMNQPLGRNAGNVLEVLESIATLRGGGPKDLVDLTVALGAQMLCLTKRAASLEAAEERLRALLASGEAYERFARMVHLQGGDAYLLNHPGRMADAALKEPLPAPRTGYITSVDAEAVGRACVLLGAGRSVAEDPVDWAVGVSDMLKIGENVERDAPLAYVHANNEERFAEARALLEQAFVIGDQAPEPRALIVDTLVSKEADA